MPSSLQLSARRVVDNVSSVFVGRAEAVELAVSCLFAGGHLLIVDLPGVGKTTLAKALGRSIDGDSKRLQFTADLLPSDITGVNVYRPAEQRFEFHKGPVFTNVFLADEINRATPRAQSSLLEAMEECQVSVEGATWPIAPPFFVIATQNPVEIQGTFPLPEAQLDRFLVGLSLGYPDYEEELRIVEDRKESDPLDALRPVLGLSETLELREECRRVHLDDEIKRYILNITRATRGHPDVLIGASPRASLGLARIAQARALLDGRDFVRPEDVKKIAPACLAHRLILKSAGRLNLERNAAPVLEILEELPLPRKR